MVSGASNDGIAGWLGDALKVRVKENAEKGKANRAVTSIVADALGVSRDSVRIVSGSTSPHKVIEVDGMTDAELREKLPQR